MEYKANVLPQNMIRKKNAINKLLKKTYSTSQDIKLEEQLLISSLPLCFSPYIPLH